MINVKAVLPELTELIHFDKLIDHFSQGKAKYYVADEKKIIDFLESLGDNVEQQELAHKLILFMSVLNHIKGNEDEA